MKRFDLNDYMLDGTIAEALSGDLHARDRLLHECRLYRQKRKKPPQKFIACLRELKKRKQGRSRRSTFLSYLIFSYIRLMREDGYSWDKIVPKCAARFKIATTRKNLEKIYYSHIEAHREYERLSNSYLTEEARECPRKT